MDKGWIKVHRKIDDNHLLSTNNSAYVMFGKLLTHCDRKTGKFRTGRNKLAALCNLKPITAYKTLRRLQTEQLVVITSNNQYTDIYICNWDKYQSESNNKVTALGRSGNTKQEREGEKNINVELQESKLLTILNEKTKRNFRVLPNGYKKTLKLFSIEEIATALSRLTEDEWHKQQLGGLSSDYLLRASTIDRFLNAEKNAGESFADRVKAMRGTA